jgi:hypothetical protein
LQKAFGTASSNIVARMNATNIVSNTPTSRFNYCILLFAIISASSFATQSVTANHGDGGPDCSSSSDETAA